MDYGMSRQEAVTLLNESVRNKNLIKHCLATEAVMKSLADKMGQDREKWEAMQGIAEDLGL